MNVSEPSPNTVELARWLLNREGGANHATAETSATIRVSEKLRRPLSILTGAIGFAALQARALALAKVQLKCLKIVSVKNDGSLDGLGGLEGHEAINAGTMLIAQLLALLRTFIGENLMLRLVRDVWPELPEKIEVEGEIKP